MKTFLIRGVPPSLQSDGWWLSGTVNDDPTPPRGPAPHPLSALRWGRGRALGLIVLLILGDWLLWQVTPGLSLALFGVILLVLAWLMFGDERPDRRWPGIAVAIGLFLPVVERVQPLSVLFWLAGLIIGAAWIGAGRWPGASGPVRFLMHAPAQIIRDLARICHYRPPTGDLTRAKTFALGWALPLGMALVFLALFIDANPMLDQWLTDALTVETPALPTIERALFWAGLALMIWPFLSLPRLRHRLALGLSAPSPRALPGIFNAASVARSLILFNLMFAVQTGMDIAYLWAGQALPDGMSYATYAHRGAYPLVATALLAGIFALAARPFVKGNRALRLALLIWVAQTVLLTISSLKRLDLYVSVYGLTHLRLAAFLWMGVVALGLAMVIWQVLRDHSAGWLLKRTAFLGAATLYGACFISFAAVVANYNLGNNTRLDAYYICRLDRAALPAIRAHEMATGRTLCKYRRPHPNHPSDWREWGFRDWRTNASLQALQVEGN